LGLQDSVQLPGFQQYPELPAYYGLAGAFVHASTTEQWGLVVNEAMASGLPVLVSRRCGCTTELVYHGINGYSFDPNDDAALAQFMAQIAGDDRRRAAMGRESSKRIPAWGPDRFASGLRSAAECASRCGAPSRRVLDDLVFEFLTARSA
jgi:glycosyltransferase involved in cell wall biosynthesis